MKRFFLLLFSILLVHFLFSQEKILPNYSTDEELRSVKPVIPESEKSFLSDPPQASVRTMAEWEEVQALVITWTGYTDILAEIVAAAVEECKVIIVTNNPAVVTNQLNFQGIPLDSVEFINHNFNSLWIRDYGPWSVYKDDVDSLYIVDWIYNRPTRIYDDIIPSAVANHLDLPIFTATEAPWDWIHTGGNNLRDGMGTNFSSDLVFDENGFKTEAEIDEIASAFLGVENYVKLQKLPYDKIHHIDMHMRIIDEETIVIGEFPEGVGDGPQIEENIRFIKTRLNTAFGNRFNVERIPMPPDQNGLYIDQGGRYRTFTNGIFVNKTFLVPIYEEQYDTTALRIFQENLPGYKVVGINCNDIIPSYGAIHCITKLVGADDPLWIAHPKLRDTWDTENDYEVMATIKHSSGINSATLYYRTNESDPYSEVSMMSLSESPDGYYAHIPVQQAGTEVHYYIAGEAVSGKQQVRPLVAPEGYFRFEVKADGPVADFYPYVRNGCVNEDISFMDFSEGAVSSWSWEFPGGEPSTSTAQNPVIYYTSPGTYDVTLTVQNEFGQDSKTRSAYLNIKEGNEPVAEDFSDGPGPLWTVDNYTHDGPTWVKVSTGNCDGGSMRMNNYNSNTTDDNDFLRAQIDLRPYVDVEMSFDVAYARYDAGNYDGMRVLVTDCLEEKTRVFQKFGSELATAPDIDAPFTPASCADWRNEVLDLSAFAGQIVTIEIENIGGYGNMLYLDNINFWTNQAPEVSVTQPTDGTIFEVFPDQFPDLLFEVDANDVDDGVAFVTFYINGDSIAVDSFAPYETNYVIPAFGDYVFSASATDTYGTVSISSEVEVGVDELVSAISPENKLNFNVFPNPAQDVIHFEIPDDLVGEEGLVRIFNAIGEELLKVDAVFLNKYFELEIDDFPAGVYACKVEVEGKTGVRKFVVGR